MDNSTGQDEPDEEVGTCTSGFHSKGRSFKRDQVPISKFTENGTIHKACEECRDHGRAYYKNKREKLANQTNDPGFKGCTSKFHNDKKRTHPKDRVPLALFMLKDETLTSCEECRNYMKAYYKRTVIVTDPNFGYCSCTDHSAASLHPKDKVPVKLFEKTPGDPILLKYCKDCRDLNLEYKANLLERKTSEVDDTEFVCKKCCRTLPIDQQDESLKCMDCKGHDVDRVKILRYRQDKFKTDLIIKLNCCCERCKNIMLFDDSGNLRQLPTNHDENGVYTVEFDSQIHNAQTFLEENKHRLALPMLHYDHLPEDEALAKGKLKPGDVFVPKRGEVSGMYSWVAIAREAAKCQLVCYKCHIIETMRREKCSIPNNYVRLEKLEYTNKLKKCGCTKCGTVEESLPRFFDFDHIDPLIKTECISEMVDKNRFTLQDVIEECKKCRIICKYCHIIHTLQQHKQGILLNIGARKKAQKLITEQENRDKKLIVEKENRDKK